MCNYIILKKILILFAVQNNILTLRSGNYKWPFVSPVYSSARQTMPDIIVTMSSEIYTSHDRLLSTSRQVFFLNIMVRSYADRMRRLTLRRRRSIKHIEQSVALTGRNTSLLARRRVLPPGELRCAVVECYRRRPKTDEDDRRQRAKQKAYTMYGRASNKLGVFTPDVLRCMVLQCRTATHRNTSGVNES